MEHDDDDVSAVVAEGEALTTLLRYSKFWNKGSAAELPYADVLRMAVDCGAKPKPEIAANVLQNLYPFQNLSAVKSTLSSIVHLQRSSLADYEHHQHHHPNNDDGIPLRFPQEYRIDRGTLECISAEASRRSASTIVHLVWEYLELVGATAALAQHRTDDESFTFHHYYRMFEPTEGMYEDAVLAFGRSVEKEDHLAFGVLTEMEERGYTPSGHLVRSLSVGLGSSLGRAQNAVYILMNSFQNDKRRREVKEKRTSRSKGDEEKNMLFDDSDDAIKEHNEIEEDDGGTGVQATTAAINAIILAFARLGKIERAFKMFDQFQRLKCDVDSHTFEYLMEGIMLDVSSATPILRRVITDGNGDDEGDGSNAMQKQKEDDQNNGPRTTTTTSPPPRIEYANQSQDREGQYEEWMASHLDSADVILLIAKQHQQLRAEAEQSVEGEEVAPPLPPIELTPHLLHNYVTILCLAGEVDRATDLLRDILRENSTDADGVDTNITTPANANANADDDNDEENISFSSGWSDISLETFSLLASNLIRSGQMGKLNEVVDMCYSAGYKDGLPSHMTKRIEHLRRRMGRR